MSEMEIFHGYFEKSGLPIEPEDNDDFYDLEEAHGCHYVRVEGDLYKFWSSGAGISPYGFSVVVEPTDKPELLLYWYNGGAGLHEVAECAIKEYLKK